MQYISKIFLFLSLSVASSFNANAIEPCDTLYTRGARVGEGHNKVVFEAGTKKPDGTCWAHDCSPSIVKERRHAEKLSADQIQIATRARDWNLAPPVYLSGECSRDKKTISFEIERACSPVTPDLISKRPEYFAGKIQRRLDRLHKENIIHGDPHIGNILIDSSDQVFLSDFDTSFLVKNPGEWKGRVAFENFLASQIWSRTSTWQLFAHKYKQFDANRDGRLSDQELDQLSDAVGSWEHAATISKLYAEELLHLSKDEKIGFFFDTYNNGVANREEMAKSKVSDTQVAAYEKMASMLRERLHSYASREKGMRQVSKHGPYRSLPLLASQILIISGGDVTEKRMFPLDTRKNFQQLAQNHGYRFQHDAGNRAAPYLGYWHKVFMLIDKLSDTDNRVVVWLDDDGVVDEKSNLIEALLDVHPNQDVIVARDPHEEAYINSGFLIIRNTQASLALLQRMIEIGHEGRSHIDERPLWFQNDHLFSCKQDFNCLHEQQALKELLTNTKHVFPNTFLKRDENDLSSKVAVISQIGSVPDKEGKRSLWDVIRGIPSHKDYQANLLIKEGATSILEGLSDTGSLQILEPRTYGQRIQENASVPFFVQCASQGKDKGECVTNLLYVKSDDHRKFFDSLPNGPYKNSCSYCINKGTYFQCQCADSAQKWRLSRTSIDCDGKIENRDGYLFCAKNTTKECSSIYTRVRPLENIRAHKTYYVRQTEQRNCWGQPCENVQVREYTHASQIKDPYLLSLIKASGATSTIYEQGECLRGQAPIYYVAQERLAPSTDAELETAPLYFEKKTYELLKRLQDSQLAIAQLRPEALHFNGNRDLVVSNLEEIQFVETTSPVKSEEFLQKELFRASPLWQGRSTWQAFLRAYKQFDYERSGTIRGDGFEELVSLTGSRERALSVKKIYEHRSKHLKSSVSEQDYNQLIAIPQKQSNPVEYIANKVCAVVDHLTAALQGVRDSFFDTAFSRYQPKSDRLVSRAAPYSTQPLFSSEILIISGGDITPKRSFPLYTRFNFLNFAKNRQYKFEHYSGNLASPNVGYWHKIYMLIDRLADPANRVVVWFDDDGVVNENSDMIEQYLGAFPEQDVIVARDPEDFAYVNSGVLIVRNTDKALALLADILTVGEMDNDRLMKCKQNYNCLHEQQALEMLLRRKTGSSTVSWPRHVAVVPQIDTRSGQNMNFLLKNGPDASFEGITQKGNKETYDRYVDFEKKYGVFPFFAQCSDARQDKNLCVRKVLEYYAPGFVARSGHAPPLGPYLDSCQCMNLGNKLECDCGSRFASISLPCSLGSIELHNGNLVCVGRDNLPVGNYESSCKNCYRTKSALRCDCHSGTRWQLSDVSIPCDQGKVVENLNGKLTCIFPKKELPKGEYSSCKDCEYRGDTLRCNCAFEFSEVSVPCPDGQTIESLDGKLLCRDSKKPIPQGSFTETCAGCVYRGNSLSCICQGGFGVRSEVEMPCDSGRIIENIRGQLKCLFPKRPIPPGAYQKAFNECEQRGDVLRCTADRGASSEMVLPCPKGQELEERNKQLVCLDKKKALPKGYYQVRPHLHSCEYRGKTLECLVSGKVTTLKLPCESDLVIDIVDGQLSCAPPQTLLPAGSYEHSCSMCKLADSFVECSCRDERRNYHTTTLKLPCFDAINQNGKLECKQQNQ